MMAKLENLFMPIKVGKEALLRWWGLHQYSIK